MSGQSGQSGHHDQSGQSDHLHNFQFYLADLWTNFQSCLVIGYGNINLIAILILISISVSKVPGKSAKKMLIVLIVHSKTMVARMGRPRSVRDKPRLSPLINAITLKYQKYVSIKRLIQSPLCLVVRQWLLALLLQQPAIL